MKLVKRVISSRAYFRSLSAKIGAMSIGGGKILFATQH